MPSLELLIADVVGVNYKHLYRVEQRASKGASIGAFYNGGRVWK